MKRPAFQFYPGDWRKDVELRACSMAARGLWIDLMCVMHECEPYGHLTLNGQPMTHAQVAGQVGATPQQVKKLLDELLDNGVARTTAAGVIYSKRMVADEDLRNRRAEGGKAGAEHGSKGAGHGAKGGRPAHGKGGYETPLGADLKPPPSSSSSSSPSGINTSEASPPHPATTAAEAVPAPRPKAIPDCPHQAVLALWAEVLPHMPQHLPTQWRGARADHLRARWRETAAEKHWASEADGLAYLRKLFAYVGQSRFLTGRVPSRDPGKPAFQIELEWLVTPSNWAKVIEGKYHQEAA